MDHYISEFLLGVGQNEFLPLTRRPGRTYLFTSLHLCPWTVSENSQGPVGIEELVSNGGKWARTGEPNEFSMHLEESRFYGLKGIVQDPDSWFG